MLSDDTITQTNHGDQWYLYEDGISATDTTYESYAFKSTSFPFVTLNGVIYCIDGEGNLCTYTSQGDTLSVVKPLVNDEVWYNYNASIASHYREKYSSLNVFDDIIVYNTPDSIVAMDADGNYLDTIFSRDSVKDAIFGINIVDGVLIAQIEPILNVSADTFGTQIYQICDLAQWYEDYKANPPVTTTTEVTTVTTEATTTTTEEETTTTTTEATTTEPTTTTESTTVTEPTTTTVTTTEPTTTTEPPVVTTTSPYSNIKYKLDLNGDANIDSADLILLMKVYRNLDKYSDSALEDYDMNGDGVVNVLDILILKSQILN